MAPIVNRLRRDYAGRISVNIIDFTAPANQALIRRYGVTATPTIIILRGNRRIATRVGLQTYTALRSDVSLALR